MDNIPLSGSVLPFGVLDLCKRNELQTAAEAMENILDLAALTDQAGYRRYWLAEHHVPYAVSSAPELLLPLLAIRTERIRIGTGGMIIGYYSPYRVAEIAHTLETLSVGRFDLGLCRGPGVIDEAIAAELVSGNLWELEGGVFERKVAKTVSLIRGGADSRGRVSMQTFAETRPQLWLLGSSANSAALANSLDMSLALALFITRDEDKAFASSKLFQARPDPESCLSRKSVLAVSIVCADTDDKALARHKRLLAGGTMPSNFIGSYKNVTGKLLKVLSRFGMDEILITLLSRDHSERMETYRALAENYWAAQV